MHTHDDKLEPKAIRRLELITGTGQRRAWSHEEKARIVEETLAPGAIVSHIARRHGLTPQQLCQRRRDFRPAGRRKIRPVGRDRRHAKGPDRALLHVGGENFSEALRGKDFARVGVDARLVDRRGGDASSRLRLSEPVALPVHLEDVDMVGEAIEQRAGQTLIAEYARPLYSSGGGRLTNQRVG